MKPVIGAPRPFLPIKFRWVTDFPNLNKALKRPVWGGESSGQLLEHVEQTARFFACFDAISGFHQVRVDEASSKLLNITTQMGNYRYTVLGQGLCSPMEQPKLTLIFNFSKMWMTFVCTVIHLKDWRNKLTRLFKCVARSI